MVLHTAPPWQVLLCPYVHVESLEPPTVEDTLQHTGVYSSTYLGYAAGWIITREKSILHFGEDSNTPMLIVTMPYDNKVPGIHKPSHTIWRILDS